MIKRAIFEELKAHLGKKEISIIAGPRQAGKTTLMFLLKSHLEKRSLKKALFLSLDIEADKDFFISQRHLLNKIQLEFGKGQGYVFIDEIQRKENAGLFLKGLYDLNLPYKFIVSGSGSMELKEKIHESLVGRKRIFELNTISFGEFIDFRTDYKYEKNLEKFFRIETDKTKEFLFEYLNFGGYPRVLLEAQLKEKQRILDDIYRSVIERDLAYLLKVEKLEAFSHLIKTLAGQTGGLVNYCELSSTLGISLKTIKNYLWYAEKMFILRKITPFFRNVRKEITKAPVIYFYDLGLRNYALGVLGNVISSPGAGFLFQNFILNVLKEKFSFTGRDIYFWRTKDKAEVDFVIDVKKGLIPVEVKFKELKKPEVERSLKNFIVRYNPKQAWIINLSFENKIRFNNTEIQFMPFYALLGENRQFDEYADEFFV